MRRLLVISGAGLSVASGIRTFRTDTASGTPMWDEFSVDEVCSISAFRGEFYHKTHDFYNARRKELSTVEPNLAHLRISEWYQRYPGAVSNLTTNVDDLLERAGIPHEEVLHVHGFLPEVIIQRDRNSSKVLLDVGYSSVDPKSYYWAKPNVVFFGEVSPYYQEMYHMLDSLTAEDLVVLVGCSHTVIDFYWELFPAVNMGTKLIVVNPVVPNIEKLEYASIPYFQCDADEAFSNPNFIEMVESHLEERPCLNKNLMPQ